jgi:hypothetical protein
MKTSNYTIWNRTSDPPICSAVPKPLGHHQRSPAEECGTFKYQLSGDDDDDDDDDDDK